LAVLDIAALCRRLPIGVEPDPIGRVYVNALDLTFERLLFGKAGHYQKRVAEDHSVRPVFIVLVKVELGSRLRRSIEIIVNIRNLVLLALRSLAAERLRAAS
jgi:hypothetical protein